MLRRGRAGRAKMQQVDAAKIFSFYRKISRKILYIEIDRNTSFR